MPGAYVHSQKTLVNALKYYVVAVGDDVCRTELSMT